ncbi:MAG: cupin domain-containing protein [Sporichthyaceae bacterium]
MADAQVTRTDLRPLANMPRIAVTTASDVDGVSVGEWTLERAAFTDRHQHAEINAVTEGELHVTCGGTTHVLGPGDRIVVPGGEKARYCAPVFARMVYVYGPGEPGMAGMLYEEL